MRPTALRARALAPALVLALAPAALAQDAPRPTPKEPPPAAGNKTDQAPQARPAPPTARAEAARKPTQTLVFDSAPTSWKPRPPEPRGFLCDYDVPAAEGDSEPARVNVLFYPVDVATYRERLSHRWAQADGQPHTKETRHSGQLEANGVRLFTEDLSGTFTPKEGPPKTGYRLLAVLVDASEGSWTAWLYGPEKTVEKHREEYLAWVRSVKVAPAPAIGSDPSGSKTPDGKLVPARPGDDPTSQVRWVHGAPEHGIPGPWALSGYRIGQNALERLGITRDRSWEIVVTHRSPRQVRYTCMLDGLLASTGASPGKMNLVSEAAADEDGIETVVVQAKTNRKLTYRLKKDFRDKIRGIDFADFPAAEKMLAGLKDDEIFEVTETKTTRDPD